MTKLCRTSMLCLLLIGFANVAPAQEGFVPLFNGKDLTGFRKVGGEATYRVENECIVGEVGPGANTFLRTEATYKNFVVEVQFQLDVPGNSGIQVRSHQKPAEDGNGRVFGYQSEIDPSPRAWTAGIYDEGRRGWLYSLADHKAAREAYKPGEWNHMIIECYGPTIKTSLNGIKCADLIDPIDAEGFIALQVHSGKAGRILWKDLQIMHLESTPWQPLLTPEILTNWKKLGTGEWELRDGVLHGTHAQDDPQHGVLLSPEKYDNFSARIVFQSLSGDSGFYVRCQPSDDELLVKGLQAQIHPEKDVAGFYEFGGRGWVHRPPADLVAKHFKPNEWNEMFVTAIGGRVVTHLNGHRISEISSERHGEPGHLGLQLHGSQALDLRIQSIDVMVLKPIFSIVDDAP